MKGLRRPIKIWFFRGCVIERVADTRRPYIRRMERAKNRLWRRKKNSQWCGVENRDIAKGHRLS